MRPNRRNAFLAKLCQVVGCDDQQLAIERVLHAYRKNTDGLRAVAINCGVDGIVEEELPFDGGIFVLPSGRKVIKLNSLLSATRRRFTLAHEIGHLVMASTTSQDMGLGCRQNPPLEHACDAIAAELLMPAKDVESLVRELEDSSPRKLKILADRFGVSLHVAARRVHQDLRLWKRRIGLWAWNNTLQEIWFIGHRPWECRTPEFSAFETARFSTKTVRCLETSREANDVKQISLELLNVGNDRIVGLVGVS